MGRSKKSKKAQGKMGKAAQRRGAKLLHGYGEAVLFGTKKPKKKAVVNEDVTETRSSSAGKVSKLVAKAQSRQSKGQDERAFGFLVDALAIVDATHEELQQQFNLLIEWASRFNLSNNQVKALGRADGWKTLPKLRVLVCFLLAVSGRPAAAEQLLNNADPALEYDERRLLSSLCHERLPEQYENVYPWGLLLQLWKQVDGDESNFQKHPSIFSQLSLCRLGRLGLSTEQQRILVLKAAQQACQLPFASRLPILLWVWHELDDQDSLKPSLLAAIKEQLANFSEMEPNAAAWILNDMKSIDQPDLAADIEHRLGLAYAAADNVPMAVDSALALASLLKPGQAEPCSRLDCLRWGFELCEAYSIADKGREIVHLIGKEDAASEAEKLRAKRGWSPVDRQVMHTRRMEASIAENPENTELRLNFLRFLLNPGNEAKSTGNTLKALDLVADLIEQSPELDELYGILEKQIDLSRNTQATSFKRLMSAAKANMAKDGRLRDFVARYTFTLTRDIDELRAILDHPVEPATEAAFQSRIRAAVEIGHMDLAEKTLSQSKDVLGDEEYDKARLEFLCQKARRDMNFDLASDPWFDELIEARGNVVRPQLAMALKSRIDPESHERGVQLFIEAHEAEPDNQTLALDVLMGVADRYVGEETYDEVATKLCERFPALASFASKFRAFSFESYRLSQEEQEAMLQSVRDELFMVRFQMIQGQHFADLAAKKQAKEAEQDEAKPEEAGAAVAEASQESSGDEGQSQ